VLTAGVATGFAIVELDRPAVGDHEYEYVVPPEGLVNSCTDEDGHMAVSGLEVVVNCAINSLEKVKTMSNASTFVL